MKLNFLVALWFYIRYATAHCQHESKMYDRTRLIMSARYLLHMSDWATVATISKLPLMQDLPFINLKIVVDGPLSNSTGIPYIIMPSFDATMNDLKANPRATMMVSLPVTGACNKASNIYDLKCIRLLLTGKMVGVQEGSAEYNFARNALLERHHRMINLQAPGHEWSILKMKISHVSIVNWFGNLRYIQLEHYYGFNYPGNEHILKYLSAFKNVERNSDDFVPQYLDKSSDFEMQHQTTEKIIHHEDRTPIGF